VTHVLYFFAGDGDVDVIIVNVESRTNFYFRNECVCKPFHRLTLAAAWMAGSVKFCVIL
jgi:hypothetical protein